MFIKKFYLVIIILFISILTVNAQESSTLSEIEGSWMGKLSVGAIELRLVFNLSLTGGDTLVATMDSPDQGAKGIPMGNVSVKGDSLIIEAPLLRGKYNGIFTSDTTINGTWSQAGNTIPLNLSLLTGGFTLKRPQEPKKPYPYKTETVNFRNEKAGISLEGTITIPNGEGPFPAAVLISGSGPQNRDEELMGHKPFLLLADYLTRNGVAVLRYDDRGFGKSEGSFAGSTSIDFSRDASAAVDFLQARSDIFKEKIGLIGHSEGGLIAPIVASSREDIAFIISLAGPGVSGEEILNAQQAIIMRLSGVSEDIIKANRKINGKFYSALKADLDNDNVEKKIIAIYSKELKKNKLSEKEQDEAIRGVTGSFRNLGYDWLRFFLTADPTLYWKNVTCPVLAINGDKDTQVPSTENLAGIDKSVRSNGNTDVTIKAFEGLNHLLQQCKTGLPNEYGAIEETINQDVLELINSWLTKRFK